MNDLSLGIRVERLDRRFFARYTPSVAKDLLGCFIVRNTGGRVLSGKIVEVEAYRGSDDPASHSFRGMTKRNSIMFEEAGHVYVFFSYGFHWCLNFTAEKKGQPGAVLIRALEPVEGIQEMIANRGIAEVGRLTNGPGKLTKALAIDGSLNGVDLVSSEEIYVLDKESRVGFRASQRIGISKGQEQQWRYFVDGNPFVSKGATSGSSPRSRVPWSAEKGNA
jgi:DNA-3-methyladenine glycosylase